MNEEILKLERRIVCLNRRIADLEEKRDVLISKLYKLKEAEPEQ